MKSRKWILGLIVGLSVTAQAKDITILNASYDVTREFYRDFNTAFAASWQKRTGDKVTINQSHGGSSKQARSVIEGLDADVVTMNQDTDIAAIAKAGLLPLDWWKRLPNHSAPYTTTIVFLVRKGNPKGIKDWDDLVHANVSVIIPNPKTSGNGRYSYLAAWGYALKKSNGDEAKAREFVAALFKNVPVLDTGGRGATTTFAQRGIGDVLLTFEGEAFSIQQELGEGQFEVVAPSRSILAEAPVALVERVASRRGTKAVAQAYLDFHYTPEGQELAAKHHFRPRLEAVALSHAKEFPTIELSTIDDIAGGWDKAQKTHFADSGIFDQLYLTK